MQLFPPEPPTDLIPIRTVLSGKGSLRRIACALASSARFLCLRFMTGGSGGNSCDSIRASEYRGVSASLDLDLSWMSLTTKPQVNKSVTVLYIYKVLGELYSDTQFDLFLWKPEP